MSGERGSSTVAASAFLGLLMTVAAALGAVAALFVDHRTAQSAADLAALAGAGAAVTGGDPCARAAGVAAANGAELRTCAVTGSEVLVTVNVAGPRWLGLSPAVTGQARAGPG